MAKAGDLTITITLANPELAEALDELRDYVNENPWCGLNEVMEVIDRAARMDVR